jgi:hypothetical protein
LLACRMVKATMKNGLAGTSAVGFCVLGTFLCCKGEIEQGAWCSEIGLELLESVEDKSVKGRVMAIHWGLLSRFEKPWMISQEPLKIAYRLCVEGGDTEVGTLSILFGRWCYSIEKLTHFYLFSSLL